MHSGQSGVFVVVADMMQLIDKMTQQLKFLITYEIKFEAKTAKLTMNAGEVAIDFTAFCGSDSQMIFQKGEGMCMGNFQKLPFIIKQFLSLQRLAGYYISINNGSTANKVWKAASTQASGVLEFNAEVHPT